MVESGPVLARIRGLSLRMVSGTASFTLVVESLTITGGSALAVSGPSGCGKSTLLGLLALAIRPDAAAEFTCAGQDVLRYWRTGNDAGLALLRGQWLGYVPQTGGLLPYLSVADNIRLMQRIAGRADGGHIASLSRQLDIDQVMDRLPSQISVGQRQRAAVARAVCHRPSLVLADEPTASVHPAQADVILHLLREAASQAGAALVVCTHDAPRARAAGLRRIDCRPEPGEALTRISDELDAACA